MVLTSTAAGVYGLTLGIGGFFKGKLNWPQRIASIIGSSLVIFGTGVVIDAVGVVLIGLPIIWQFFKENNCNG
jgi:TRAP-type uncharacterized transport system fused permease subunit